MAGYNDNMYPTSHGTCSCMAELFVQILLSLASRLLGFLPTLKSD